MRFASAMEEYGNCIKQLARQPIFFPAICHLKNFGVTRHARVVFYDYDEIAALTDCNFRKIPQPRTEEEEMQSGTWYTVGQTIFSQKNFGCSFPAILKHGRCSKRCTVIFTTWIFGRACRRKFAMDLFSMCSPIVAPSVSIAAKSLFWKCFLTRLFLKGLAIKRQLINS